MQLAISDRKKNDVYCNQQLGHGYSGTTRFARSGAIRMFAIAPELNSRLSASTPSEKMTPPPGIWDSRASGAIGLMVPATIFPCEWRLINGSRTTNKSFSSSHAMLIGFTALPPRNDSMPAVSLKMEDSHPVLPAPVETIIPLDE